MSADLTGKKIRNTYGRLIQKSGSLFYDGFGNQVIIGNGGTIDSSSFVTTASFNDFTASYYVASASFDARIDAVPTDFTHITASSVSASGNIYATTASIQYIDLNGGVITQGSDGGLIELSDTFVVNNLDGFNVNELGDIFVRHISSSGNTTIDGDITATTASFQQINLGDVGAGTTIVDDSGEFCWFISRMVG